MRTGEAATAERRFPQKDQGHPFAGGWPFCLRQKMLRADPVRVDMSSHGIFV